jgi:hypothetical protein
MTIKSKLLTGAGLLVLSTGFALAAPAVVQSPVNLRDGPGVGFPIIAAMPAGAPVDVMGCRGGWCRVAFGRTVGFASRDFLALGGPPGGPGYATFGEGYGPGYGTVGVGDEYEYGGYGPGRSYSYGTTTGYSRGYGGTEYGTNVRGVNREERLGVSNESRTREFRTNEARTGELRTGEARTRGARTGEARTGEARTATPITGNNPMRIRASTHNPNLRTEGQATPITGNNPMRIRQSTTATAERGARRPSETTGSAPGQRRQPGQGQPGQGY